MQTSGNRHHKECLRGITLHGPTPQAGTAGANTLLLARTLAPGNYVRVATSSPVAHRPRRSSRRRAKEAAGLEPLTPHEARHCAISYFIAPGPDWKQISTWAGHGDVRQTWNRYGHLVPGGEEQARQRLDAFLPGPTLAHEPVKDETPEIREF